MSDDIQLSATRRILAGCRRASASLGAFQTDLENICTALAEGRETLLAENARLQVEVEALRREVASLRDSNNNLRGYRL